MANALYPKGGQGLMQGDYSFASDLRVILIDSADHAYSDADDFLNDITAAARVATSTALSSKTYTDGVLDAADVTWSTVSGDQSEAILLYYHSGVETTSNLIFWWDTGVTGLPVTPNGQDIIVQWNASGILSISL